MTLYVDGKQWGPYAQEVLDVWSRYTDREGKKLRSRPHWAKQWHEFTMDGKPFPEVIKTQLYRDEIVEFKRTLADIGVMHGWTLSDLKRRFSNDFFNSLFFEDIEPRRADVAGVANESLKPKSADVSDPWRCSRESRLR